MPDGLAAAEGKAFQQRSLVALHAHLAGPKMGGVPCNGATLAVYEKHSPIAGWRLGLQFQDKVRYLDLIVDRRFPYSVPRIMLVEPPPFLTWPHVEKDGALCLLGNHGTIDPNDPVSVASHELKEAVQLIEASLQGANENDFRDEFCSYWDHASTEHASRVISLLEPTAPSRLVQVWRGHAFYLLAEEGSVAGAWLRNRFREMPAKELATETALFLSLNRPLLPREYPQSAKDVLALVRKAGPASAALLDKIVAGQPERTIVAFVAETANGPCLCAVSVNKPKTGEYGPKEPLLKGFRKHTTPPALLTNRYIRGPANRSSVRRADHTWIHGRGNETADLQKLRSAHLVLAGVGSLGAPIAVLLAQSGVGRMSFLDHDTLSWGNIGRHPLGAVDVDKNKAVGLRDHLRERFPHLSIDAYPWRWEEAYATNPTLLDDATLVISATGDWGTEASLNQWHVDRGRIVPVMYVWTEPHGCAGHAVAIAGNGPCLACGFTSNGKPTFAVTHWKSGTLRQEPACGATYQPYGAVDLTQTIAVGARLAMDCLAGSIPISLHRIWAGSLRGLEKAGGEWSPEWKLFAKNRLEGGFESERRWSAASLCASCRMAQAA